MTLHIESSNQILDTAYTNGYIERKVQDKNTASYTPIQQFYEKQTIFITGATGFLGKILIEKLLRTCPRISKIFILIREKKGKSVDERMKNILQDSIFDSNKSNIVNLETKIQVVSGDCSLENLGLSDYDAELLKREVSIVFHVAATVRFDEKLKCAVATNVRSTSAIINICKGMENLKSFVHVSTAYANCFASDIEEKFYNYPINYKNLLPSIDTLPEKMIEAITPHLIQGWPNTYTFTKALAEDLIRLECTNLPVAIFRPGIVTPSAYEPIPGWTDNYNGPVGITAGVACGIMRTFCCDINGLANFVPVDLTVNALIASAWDSTLQTNRKADDMLIYNFTSVNDAPITWGTVGKNFVKNINKYPLHTAMWCTIFRVTNHALMYRFYVFFLHLLPAYFIDFCMRIIGKKPRMVRTYDKINKIASALSHFVNNSWKIRDTNVHNMWNRLDTRDQQMYQFSMLNFDWDRYFDNYVKGIRVFLFQDDMKTLEASQLKYERFVLIHKLLLASLMGFAAWILWRLRSITTNLVT